MPFNLTMLLILLPLNLSAELSLTKEHSAPESKQNGTDLPVELLIVPNDGAKVQMSTRFSITRSFPLDRPFGQTDAKCSSSSHLKHLTVDRSFDPCVELPWWLFP